jgi:hypothetical protein
VFAGPVDQRVDDPEHLPTGGGHLGVELADLLEERQVAPLALLAANVRRVGVTRGSVFAVSGVE